MARKQPVIGAKTVYECEFCGSNGPLLFTSIMGLRMHTRHCHPNRVPQRLIEHDEKHVRTQNMYIMTCYIPHEMIDAMTHRVYVDSRFENRSDFVRHALKHYLEVSNIDSILKEEGDA